MNIEDVPVVETWGHRFSRESKRMAARRIPKVPWLRELTPLLEHLTALPTPAEARFKRDETVGDRQPEPLVVLPSIEDEAVPLPPAVRERLALTGVPKLESVRILTGPKADAIAQEH